VLNGYQRPNSSMTNSSLVGELVAFLRRFRDATEVRSITSHRIGCAVENQSAVAPRQSRQITETDFGRGIACEGFMVKL
jgi:hypothetical protein